MCGENKLSWKYDYIINIVDYFGPSKNFYLIKYLSSVLLKNNNAECVNIYSYGIEEKYLRQAGFKDINEYEGLIVPGLFEPYENKKFRYILLLFIIQPQVVK